MTGAGLTGDLNYIQLELTQLNRAVKEEVAV